MIANLLLSLSLLLPLPTVPRATHVDVVPIDGAQRVVVTWSDGAVTVAPDNDVLTTSWRDVNGLRRSVITDCAKAKSIADCVTSHNKAVDLMLQVAPLPAPPPAKGETHK